MNKGEKQRRSEEGEITDKGEGVGRAAGGMESKMVAEGK